MKFSTRKFSPVFALMTALLFAGPAMAAPDHHAPSVGAVKVAKTVKVAVSNPRYPRRVRRVRRVRRNRRRVVRRRVVRRAPPRVVTTKTVIARPKLSLQPRAARPVRLSFTQKGVAMTGVELGVRLGNHIELTAATGVTSSPVAVIGCAGPGCQTEPAPSWATSVRVYPVRSGLSPYVSAGLMGHAYDPASTVGLVGAGVNWSTHSGFTASLGVDYAIGETDSRKMVVPSLQIGYAF